jgi:hypothetical protein
MHATATIAAPPTTCPACPVGTDLCRGLTHKRDCHHVAARRPGYPAMLRRLAGLPTPGADRFLFTGGVGDFLALDSWMDPAYRAGCRALLWAAPNAALIRELIAACPAWPRGIAHVDLWTDFSSRRAWYNFVELEDAVGREALANADDWCAARIFPEILSGGHTWHGSPLLAGPPLVDLARLDLPSRYTLVCPATVSTHRLDRFFSPGEWDWTVARLAARDEVGVVVGTGDDPVPDHPRLRNLMNATTLLEAAEISRRCSGYVGIDACWTVLAAQVLPDSDIVIRTTIDHVYRYAKVYYGPRPGYPFLVRSLDDGPVAGGDRALPVLTRYPVEHLDDRLMICREIGVVLPRHPEPDVEYDESYFVRYQGYAQTEIGRKLNKFRHNLVRNFIGCNGSVLDIGIGAGTFLENWKGKGLGYDVNPAGVAWLKERGRWHDPYAGPPPAVDAVTWFDSFEHIRDPQVLLDRLPSGMFAIVTLPVFPELTAEAINASKHRRPGEHLHYWQPEGLIKYFRLLGWTFLHINDEESKLGRESIQSFVFKKV